MIDDIDADVLDVLDAWRWLFLETNLVQLVRGGLASSDGRALGGSGGSDAPASVQETGREGDDMGIFGNKKHADAPKELREALAPLNVLNDKLQAIKLGEQEDEQGEGEGETRAYSGLGRGRREANARDRRCCRGCSSKEQANAALGHAPFRLPTLPGVLCQAER